MEADAILVIGKALIWFALPLAFAVHQVWTLRCERRRKRDDEVD